MKAAWGDAASGMRALGGDAREPRRQRDLRDLHLPRHPPHTRPASCSESLPPAAGSQRGSGRGPITSRQPDHVPPPPGVAATVAAARADSTHSVPSLRAAPLREGLLGIHLCVSLALALPLLHSSNTSLSVAPFHHIRIGVALNSWQAAPRLGAARPSFGPALPYRGSCLGQEARAGQARCRLHSPGPAFLGKSPQKPLSILPSKGL